MLLMHRWREVYPTPTYPSVILSTPICTCIRNEFPFLLSNIAITTHVYLLLFEENIGEFHSLQLSHSFSRVRIFVTPWTAARQSFLSILTPRAYSNSSPLSRYATRWCLLSQRFFSFSFWDSHDWDHMVFVFLWLSLLSIMPSSFIHVATNGSISFFVKCLNHIYLYMSHHIVLIHPSFETYSGCSYTKATVNNAAMNMGIQISLWDNDFSSFDCISRSGIWIT